MTRGRGCKDLALIVLPFDPKSVVSSCASSALVLRDSPIISLLSELTLFPILGRRLGGVFSAASGGTKVPGPIDLRGLLTDEAVLLNAFGGN